MNYKESITALLEGLKGIFENKTATEASAIAQAATKPSTIFYTSDTHAIVVGGKVYGRSNQVSADAPFAYLPADVASPSADPQFDGNHDTIYIQPIKTGADAGKIKLWWYVNGAWTSTDTLDLVLPTEASDITYDLTNTPDLGSGDVQSAIEALDGKVEEVKEDVVRTGYLISSWEDDKILTSTTYAVGSTIGDFATNARYGSRGVRLNVKEGDKVLLDTYSPALFGLIFTDENRVVKALYDDRRFDGVWTAPCDGYCYIQDVLYRENYHYASAHGHLAYMAHDARKRVAKGGDWYNEYAPRILGDCLCEVNVANASSAMRYAASLDGSQVGSQILETSRNANKFTLHASYIKFFADNEASGSVSNHNWGVYNVGVNNIKSLPFTAGVESEGWAVAITRANGDYYNAVYGAYFSLSEKAHLHAQYIKTFLHSSYDFAELYQLGQKIANGEVEVDNFYGVKEKEVDLVRNAIGLQSISDLGYNILEHGATLPIDEEGYKYAKELYDRYKDNPPSTSTQRLFENDQKLVYLPSIDFSVARNGGSFMQYTFQNCYNLICVDDIEMPSNNPTYYNNNLSGTFQNCRCLKRVGNITCPTNRDTNLGATFSGCYALEYVGKIIAPSSQSMAQAFRYTYSLKRIEELNMKNVNDMSNCFQYCGAEYLLMKNIGMVVSYNHSFSALLQWGINSEENPDARQSLVDSLLTYSYDRVNDPDELGTAGTTCTITLSANSYAQLTASEIEAITAKGYTLTHP